MNDDMFDDIFNETNEGLGQNDGYFGTGEAPAQTQIREEHQTAGQGSDENQDSNKNEAKKSVGNGPVTPKGSKPWLKIVVPVLIIAVVAAIWFFKNAQANDVNLSAQQPTNPDFALNVTDELNLDKLKTYGLPIIIDFGADWCVPCKEMKPVLVKLNEELQGRAIIKYVDVDKFPEIAGEYPVSVIPTQVFYDSAGNPFSPAAPEQYGLVLYSWKEGGAHALTAHEGGLTEEMMLGMLSKMGMK